MLHFDSHTPHINVSFLCIPFSSRLLPPPSWAFFFSYFSPPPSHPFSHTQIDDAMGFVPASNPSDKHECTTSLCVLIQKWVLNYDVIWYAWNIIISNFGDMKAPPSWRECVINPAHLCTSSNVISSSNSFCFLSTILGVQSQHFGSYWVTTPPQNLPDWNPTFLIGK